MAIAEQWQFAVNALFHLAAWITLGDYAVGTAGPWAAATVDLAGELVGRDGIEPPTLRFSAGAAHPAPFAMIRPSRFWPGEQGYGWAHRAEWYGCVRLGSDWLGRTPAESRPCALCPKMSRASGG
jgi:hypothetical protein